MKLKNLLCALALTTSGTANAEGPHMLDGSYLVELKIQDRIFIDRLELIGINSPLHPHHFSGNISGTMEVPGVFKVPLTGKAHCTLWGGFCTFEYTIVAKENGEEFEVNYKMEIRGEEYTHAITGQPFKMNGEAFLSDGRLLGPFTAVKQNE
jgi:hypothetical protein